MSMVIAEREFCCGAGAAHIRVFAPQPDGRDWRCDYEIAWPGRPRRSYAMGVDGFQALQLAMFSVATDLSTSEECKAGDIKIFDEPVMTAAQLNQLFSMPWTYNQ